MTEQEYRDAKDIIVDRLARAEKLVKNELWELDKDFVVRNNKVRVGDILIWRNGNIRVENRKIKSSSLDSQELPMMVYYGEPLTKKLKPYKIRTKDKYGRVLAGDIEKVIPGKENENND